MAKKLLDEGHVSGNIEIVFHAGLGTSPAERRLAGPHLTPFRHDAPLGG